MDKWWERLEKQSDEIRCEINWIRNHRIVSWLRIMAITILGFVVAIVLSTFQPIYILDKLGFLLVVLVVFEFGIAIGLGISERITEEVFKAYADTRAKETT